MKGARAAACNDRGMRFSRFSIRICRQCIRLARKSKPPRRSSSPRFLERLFVAFRPLSIRVYPSFTSPSSPIHCPLKIAHAASNSSQAGAVYLDSSRMFARRGTFLLAQAEVYSERACTVVSVLSLLVNIECKFLRERENEGSTSHDFY